MSLTQLVKDIAHFVQAPGFEPGMPTYSPLRGEFFAARLPDKKNIKNKIK
jgi:hypothetical protein